MWKYIKFNKVNYSAFFFANLWVAFTCFFVLKFQMLQLASYIQNLIVKDFNQNTSPATMFYYSMLLVYFIVILLAMIFVMKPLNIHIPDTKIEWWEQALTFILIVGFFLYSFHKIFDYGMPELFWPQLVKFISGASGRYIENNRPIEVGVLWSNLSDLFWNFVPLGFMWYRAKTGGAQ
ncbi:MAG: hypothetical protein ACRCXZ_06310 [Patescibacteria group bacterium]